MPSPGVSWGGKFLQELSPIAVSGQGWLYDSHGPGSKESTGPLDKKINKISRHNSKALNPGKGSSE